MHFQPELLLRELYGKNARRTEALPGEIDLNFYVETENAEIFTLKIANAAERGDNLDMQCQALKRLEECNIPIAIPRIVPNLRGELISETTDEAGRTRYVRLLHWVDGRVFAKVHPHSPELLESLGEACGHLSRALEGFDHPAAHRFIKWDPSEAAWTRESLQHIADPAQRETAEYFVQLFEKNAVPLFSSLRRSINYNDLNDYNILVSADTEQPRVHGVIDFGDAVYSHTVNELAIAIAYAVMDKPDPLDAALHIVRGAHRIFPLQEPELEALYTLVGARLLISVTCSAINKHEHPDNEYLLISERPAWELLDKWRAIHPDLAHYAFRGACGLPPVPQRAAFDTWLATHAHQCAAVLRFDPARACTLDLGVGSLDLGNNSVFDDTPAFEKWLRRHLEDAGTETAVGGYGEVRPIYTTDNYLVMGNEGPMWRTVHLGLDIWAPAGTPVYAPLDATVHSLQYNALDRDYGYTIILEHSPADGPVFYSLYGHLGSAGFDRLKQGQMLRKGEQIGVLGDRFENGNWPPHLHFQLLLNTLGQQGDFPGVAFPDQRQVWLALCPDPAPLAGATPKRAAAPDSTDILTRRREHLGKNLSISYRQPLHMQRAFMQYLYDETGRRYLDTVNNVPHVGHQHPRVVRAAQRQTALLNTNTRYLHENIVRFAEELCATLPPELEVCYFVNSGSEANELALRLARNWTGRRDMIVSEIGYHGNTTGCVDISSYKFDGPGGKGAPEHIHVVPIPDTYRGLYRRNDPQAGEKYAAHVLEACNKAAERGGVAGFICESIISCGGQVVLPDNYWKKAYEYVRAAGGLCIADEVQVGFGRVGNHFWAFEAQGVVPDIVTMGKPIGNGHPLGAVVTTKAISDAFANGMEYFNTFGGNPVSCAIGREVLAVIRDEGLQEHARSTGDYLSAGLRWLQSRFPIIGDVRGPGLFLGFEMVRNADTLEPATRQAAWLANRMRSLGILMSTDGPYNNVLKVKPPMAFNRHNADLLLDMLEKVLQEDALQI